MQDSILPKEHQVAQLVGLALIHHQQVLNNVPAVAQENIRINMDQQAVPIVTRAGFLLQALLLVDLHVHQAHLYQILRHVRIVQEELIRAIMDLLLVQHVPLPNTRLMPPHHV
jgi:hypothetical protein